jgi:hypothetical protein
MADVAADLKTWSATASSNTPAGGTAVGTGLDDNLREIQKVVRQDLATKGSDIASASSTDLGAVAGLMHDITGTTTITGFGTVSAGIWKILKYEGALTITHNATSLILLGGENRTTADGDTQIVMSEGSGNWREIAYFPVAINPGKAVSTDESQTLTNKTLTSPVLNTGVSGTAVADAATTLTGSSTTTVLTPGGFAGNKDITGTGGYYKLPGGLIIQWETLTTDATGDVTWTYATAFASAVFAVVATARSGDTAHMVSADTPATTTCGIHVRAHDDSQPNAAVLFAVAIGV